MTHHVEGGTFQRREDGSVCVTLDARHVRGVADDRIDVELDADQWVSVLTSMAKDADTAQAHALAAKLHLGVAPAPTRECFEQPRFTGRHAPLYLLPEHLQARFVGWKLMRRGGRYHGVDLETTRVVLRFPGGAYRVVDSSGRVEPCDRPVGLPT